MAMSVEERFHKFYATVKGRAGHMLNNARARARRKQLPCDLDYQFIADKLINGKCEVTGLSFVIQSCTGKGHKTNSFSPSLDRIDNTKGYTKDNVRMVVWIYNRAKGAFPISDLLTMLRALDNKT
jgi:hypothetical protein